VSPETAWHAVLPRAMAEGPLAEALGAAGFQVWSDGDSLPAGTAAVIVNALALGAAPSPDEADALLALMLGAQEAVRLLPGGGRVITLVRGGGPAAAGALVLGRALREELRGRRIGVTTLTLGPGAAPGDIAGLSALAARGPAPGGLEEATLSA
jgi:hypothetical protein